MNSRKIKYYIKHFGVPSIIIVILTSLIIFLSVVANNIVKEQDSKVPKKCYYRDADNIKQEAVYCEVKAGLSHIYTKDGYVIITDPGNIGLVEQN